MSEQKEMVNHPDHYGGEDNPYEAIKVIDAWDLDKDAQKQALNFCQQLMNEGKEVYLVDMQDKDPSEMGFKQFTNVIQETDSLTFSDLLAKKLML